jgi:hypothetical protein
MAALKNSQIAALDATQLYGFSTDQLAAWSTSQLGSLTATQIGYLSTTQIAGLSNTQIAGLKTSQLVAFSTNQIRALAAAQMPALTATQLGVLSVAQADALTSTQIASMSIAQTMALNSSSVNYATPLILDLDGNGVQTRSITAGVQFDIRGDGQKVSTGWVDAHDGLLALDRNGDGVINDGSELFGSGTTLADGSKAKDGYAALAALDSNGDGQITAADSAYGALRVWVDGNGDGISQADELKTLAQLGIASISTKANSALTQQNGNVIGLTSSYTSTDGSVHQSADAWFLADKATSTASLQQQVSGLTNALASYAAAPAAPAQQLTLPPSATSAAAAAATTPLAAALDHYRAQHSLQGAATGPTKPAFEEQASQWFAVPKR